MTKRIDVDSMKRGLGIPDHKRFWARVIVGPGCWGWRLKPNSEGYSTLWTQAQRNVRAHRFAYELLVGQVPDGMELDHLCRNRACVNPAHLEPVTSRENNLRGDTHAGRNARKVTCSKGHPLVFSKGHRMCRECANAANRKYKAKRRAERKAA